MSDNASGNGTEDRRDDDQEIEATHIPEGEELVIDPEAGDQLDPIDRWWDDSGEEDREGRANRRLTEEDRLAAEAAKAEEKERADKEEEESEGEIAAPVDELDEASDEESADAEESEDASEPDDTEGDDDQESSQEDGSAGDDGEDEDENFDVGALLTKSDPVEEDLDALFSKTLSLEDEGEEAEAEESDEDKEDALPWEDESDEDTSEDVKESSESKSGSQDEELLLVRLDEEDEAPSDNAEEDKSKKKGKKVVVAKDEESKDEDSKDEDSKDEDSKDEESDEPDSTKVVAPVLNIPKTRKVEKKDEEVETLKPAKSSGEDEGEVDDAEFEDSADLGLGEMLATPAEAKVAPAQQKKKAGCWTIFATLFFILTLLVLVALGVGGYLAWNKLGELESEITSRAQAKLEERGIFVEYEAWEYQFPRGLVLKGVTLFEGEARQVPQLKLSDLGVNIDVISLIKDQSEINSAEVSFQDSTLTFFQGGDSVAQLEEIDAEILASSSEVDLERFSGLIGGLHVRASGRVALPQDEAVATEGATEAGASVRLPLDFAMLEKVRPWLDVQANGKVPMLDVTFSTDETGIDSLTLNGSFRGSDFVWHGVPVTRASMAFSYDAPANALDLFSFQLGHGDGFVSGVASLDLETKVMTLDNAQSDVDLIAMLSAFDSELAGKLNAVSFKDAPNIQLSGSIPLEDAMNADIEMSYDHLLGLVYTGDSRELPISHLKTDLVLSDGVLKFDSLTARSLGGDIDLGCSIRLVADDYPFSVTLLRISELPLTAVAKYFEMDSLGMAGDLNLEFRGSGSTDLSKVRGGGNLHVKEAKLTAFPVLGKTQKFLGSVIPAFGVRTGDSLTGSYIIESGILLTNDLTIDQVGARVVVAGNLKLESKLADFTATAGLKPDISVGTGLEGKEIIVVGEGPLADPTIRLKDIPLEFVSGELGKLLGTTPETMSQLKELIDGEADIAKQLSEQLESALGEEAVTPEVQSLINGILGNMPPIETPAEGAQETTDPPAPEAAVPADPVATPATPVPATPVPFRAMPVPVEE